MKNYFFILLAFLIAGEAFGQSGDNAPVVYDQFFKNYFLLNAALTDTSVKTEAALGNRTLTGLFEGVNRFYADINLLINTKNRARYHGLGIQAFNNRDGEYFSRSRLYLRYSWYTSLTDYSAVSAGASVGFVNYSFKASPASAGGSSFAPDANLGLWYIRENFKAGIALQQLTTPFLKPVSQVFILDKYVNFNLIHKAELRQNLLLQTNVYYKYQSNMEGHLELAPVFLFYDTFETGVNYRYKRGVAVVAGLKNIALGKNYFRCMVSYLISTRKLGSVNDGILEFSFGYSIPQSGP